MKVEDKSVLERGEHAGFEWAMLIGPMACRNGYVRIPKGHAWHDVSSSDLPAEVHGGITYSGSLFDDDSYWIGFDTCHSGDLGDPELAKMVSDQRVQSVLEDHLVFTKHGATVKSADYVRQEIFNLCEQARDNADKPIVCDKCNGKGHL